jgi:hypothetical protein
MRIRTLCLAAVAGLLLLPGTGWGQAKVGTSGFQFLQIGVSARAVAMGESFIAEGTDASALFYNPGAVDRIGHREAMFTYISYPADITYNYGAAVWPLRGSIGGTVGLQVMALTMDDMPVTTPDYSNGTGETFTAGDFAMGLTYSRSLTDRFSIGATFKFISEYLDDVTSNVWAVDIGTYYETGFKSLRVGMAIMNFGPDGEFISDDVPMPVDFRFGVAMDLLNSPGHMATVSLTGIHPNDQEEQFTTGVEYTFNRLLSLRMGHRFNNDLGDFPAGLSAGAGLSVPIGTFRGKVDYAYTDMGYLETVHRFTVGFEF